MSRSDDRPAEAATELKVLRRQLVSLAEIVESAFAESIVALVDSDLEVAGEVSQEDYKVHRACLQADAVGLDLLSSGDLYPDDVRFVCGAMKIATILKMVADESVRISQQIRACPAEKFSPGPAADIIPSMAEMAQSMLSDCIEAFVSRDSSRARGLHLVYRELNSVGRQLQQQVGGGIASAQQSPEVGVALVLVGRALEAVGLHALELSNQLLRLYPAEEARQGPADSGQ